MVKQGELNVQRRIVLHGRISPYPQKDNNLPKRKVVPNNLKGVFGLKIIGEKNETQENNKKKNK